MKSTLTAVALSLLASPAQEEKAPDFTLSDIAGRTVALKDFRESKAVVLFFIGTECPMANRYLPRLNDLAKAYGPKGVAVLAINPSALETVEAIVAHAKAQGVAVPVLLDRDQKVADALKVAIVPTAVVLDASRVVRYSGLFDDHKAEDLVKRRHVAVALDAVLAGREVATPRTEATGCTIQRALTETSGEVTFAEHVAPILNEHCVECHRPGQVAPFALTSYESARRWSRDVKRSVQAKRMPPWKPANHGVFRGERRLDDAKIALLAKWADGGAPLGDEKKLPPAPRFSEGWMLGEPDLVLEMPEYDIAPEGADEYRTFALDPKLTEDRYVTAIEYRPGNARVVHHIFATIDEKGASAAYDAKDPAPGYATKGTGPGFIPLGDLGGWGPGMQPSPVPEGTGYLLPKGSLIAMECHYHRNGRKEKDRTRVGLHFAKGPVKQRVRSNVVINFDFEIPAGEKRWLVTAQWTLKEDIHAIAVIPHMHLLGKEMLVTAVKADKSEEVLVHVKDWDFNWQETYFFKEPRALAAGTKVRVKGWFDNSAANPNNPRDPPRAVQFGEDTTDEMVVAYFAYTRDKEK